MSSELSDMELELRLVPGVINVGLEPIEDVGPLQVTVVTQGAGSDLERTVTRIARSYRAGAMVEVADVAQPPAQPESLALALCEERVALHSARVDATGQARVELSWKGKGVSTTSPGGELIGPAQATLAALGGLEITIGLVLGSVSTGRGLSHSPVRVILRSPCGPEEFIGIARAPSPPEASARATLAAFNRYVGAGITRLN